MEYKDLALSEELMKAVERMGFVPVSYTHLNHRYHLECGKGFAGDGGKDPAGPGCPG